MRLYINTHFLCKGAKGNSTTQKECVSYCYFVMFIAVLRLLGTGMSDRYDKIRPIQYFFSPLLLLQHNNKVLS